MLKKLLRKMNWMNDKDELRRREFIIDIIAIGLLVLIAYGFYISEV